MLAGEGERGGTPANTLESRQPNSQAQIRKSSEGRDVFGAAVAAGVGTEGGAGGVLFFLLGCRGPAVAVFFFDDDDGAAAFFFACDMALPLVSTLRPGRTPCPSG